MYTRYSFCYDATRPVSKYCKYVQYYSRPIRGTRSPVSTYNSSIRPIFGARFVPCNATRPVHGARFVDARYTLLLGRYWVYTYIVARVTLGSRLARGFSSRNTAITDFVSLVYRLLGYESYERYASRDYVQCNATECETLWAVWPYRCGPPRVSISTDATATPRRSTDPVTATFPPIDRPLYRYFPADPRYRTAADPRRHRPAPGLGRCAAAQRLWYPSHPPPDHSRTTCHGNAPVSPVARRLKILVVRGGGSVGVCRLTHVRTFEQRLQLSGGRGCTENSGKDNGIPWKGKYGRRCKCGGASYNIHCWIIENNNVST